MKKPTCGKRGDNSKKNGGFFSKMEEPFLKMEG
jgi:hypothetical protein